MVLQSRLVWTTTLAALLVLAGCASRPVNPPMTQVDPNGGYTFQTRQKHFKSRDTLVVLAFSGGGTRAAAFSYGALEFLRRTEVAAPDGTKLRLLDAVDMITGVSGGSFTALAYGLYGDKLFADYEQRFLKRNVQGELLSRAASPGHWADYIGGTAGRSELAANYYDEILFNGATFGDLDRGDGPYIVASATDISVSYTHLRAHETVLDLVCRPPRRRQRHPPRPGPAPPPARHRHPRRRTQHRRDSRRPRPSRHKPADDEQVPADHPRTRPPTPPRVASAPLRDVDLPVLHPDDWPPRPALADRADAGLPALRLLPRAGRHRGCRPPGVRSCARAGRDPRRARR